jgi:hypothetical protein
MRLVEGGLVSRWTGSTKSRREPGGMCFACRVDSLPGGRSTSSPRRPALDLWNSANCSGRANPRGSGTGYGLPAISPDLLCPLPPGRQGFRKPPIAPRAKRKPGSTARGRACPDLAVRSDDGGGLFWLNDSEGVDDFGDFVVIPPLRESVGLCIAGAATPFSIP